MAFDPANAATWLDPLMTMSYPNVGAYITADIPKRHAACDECRQRKLKCSGEAIGCSRCVKQGLFCHYSLQKQMGRPPKRKRTDEVNISTSSQPLDDRTVTDLLPALLEGVPDAVGALEASNMCPSIYKSFMKNQYDFQAGPFLTSGPILEFETLEPEPFHEWKPKDPDYSHIDTSILFQSSESVSTNSRFPLIAPQTTTSCSCLSYLYLCLSSISTLSSFPLSVHTLTTLYTAARTAKSVIHCQVCPQAFNTSMQNLMLLGTLLNVVADAWLLVSSKDAEALGSQSVDPSYIASLPSEPDLRREHWKRWLHSVVKHAVLGSSVPPIVHAVQSQCLETPSLLSLIEDMEERQRRRHAEMQNGQHAEPHVGVPVTDALVVATQSQYEKNGDEQDYFCLRVVGTARMVIARFDFDQGG